MKTTIRTWMMPALCAAGCGIAALLAEDKELNPFDHPELGEVRMIQVRVEFVEMSHAKLTELLFLEEPSLRSQITRDRNYQKPTCDPLTHRTTDATAFQTRRSRICLSPAWKNR